jgi:hypothetical protein
VIDVFVAHADVTRANATKKQSSLCRTMVIGIPCNVPVTARHIRFRLSGAIELVHQAAAPQPRKTD